MFLGAFERVFKGLQKTGLNRSRPVNVNRCFCGLYISKKKDWTAGPVFCSLGPVWLRSFSGHETGLLNTTDSPLKSSPISSPVPLQPLLPPESMHTPNPAAGTEWVVRCDGAALEVDLDVYPQPLPRSSPETISTPQLSMGVLMLAFTYISWQMIVLVMLLTDEQRG